MKKYIASAVMLIAFVMAMSCGGGSDSATGTSYSIAGAIDAGVVGTDTSSLVVNAIDTSDTTKSFKGTITAGTSGEDHTYSITGLESSEYSIIVSREYQGTNPFEKAKVELVSSVVTATTTTGTLTKPARLKRKYKRQCNMASSYVSRNYRKAKKSGSTTVTLTSIVEKTFGTGVNLEEIVSDGGKLSVGGTSIVYKDPIAKMAVTQLTFATVAAVTMSESSVLSQASSLESFAATLSAATATDIAAILTAQATTFSALLSSADSTTFATLAASADSVANTFLSGSTSLIAALTTITVTTLIETSFAIATTEATLAGVTLDSTYITALASTSTTITTTTIITSSTTLVTSLGTSAGLTTAQVTETNNSIAAATTTTVTVNSFDLADATFGTKTGSNFMLYSLAPVFKVTLATAVTSGTGFAKIEDLVNLTLTHGATSTVVTSSNAKAWSSDGLTYYIHVFNTSAVAKSGSELEAGETYTYSIASKDTATYTLKSTSTSGTITVADITFTLPFDGSANNTSQVALGTSTTYNGLSVSSALTFVVNSASSVTYSTTDTDIIGATGLITGLTRGGSAITGAVVSAASETSGTISVTLTQGGSTKTGITITDIVGSGSTGTGFKLNIPTGFIQAGTNSITITKGTRAANRTMPTTLSVTGK